MKSVMEYFSKYLFVIHAPLNIYNMSNIEYTGGEGIDVRNERKILNLRETRSQIRQ